MFWPLPVRCEVRLLLQYDDYDPTDIPADQAAPAPAEYLPAPRRGRKLSNRKEMSAMGKMKRKMKEHMKMLNTKRAKTGQNQRKPKAFRSSLRRFSGRALSSATSEARRQGRQIMSVSEWLRRGWPARLEDTATWLTYYNLYRTSCSGLVIVQSL